MGGFHGYRSPGGQTARSRVETWRVHEREGGRSESLDFDAEACLPCDDEPRNAPPTLMRRRREFFASP